MIGKPLVQPNLFRYSTSLCTSLVHLHASIFKPVTVMVCVLVQSLEVPESPFAEAASSAGPQGNEDSPPDRASPSGMFEHQH